MIFRSMVPLVAWSALVFCSLRGMADEADARLPIPSAIAQQAGEARVKESFPAEYARANKPDGKADLAEKLFAAVEKEKDDPDTRYVMLREARSLAIDLGYPVLLGRVCRKTAELYRMDALAGQAFGLEKMAVGQHSHEVNEDIVRETRVFIAAAEAADRFDLARRAGEAATNMVRTSKDRPLIQRAEEMMQDLAAAEKESQAVKQAEATLKEKPDDPAAQLTLGRYLCFIKGDWESGLPRLAAGSDATLAQMAKDTLARPTDSKAQLTLADQWWTLGESAPKREQAMVQIQAAYWYMQAYPSVKNKQLQARAQIRASVGHRLALRVKLASKAALVSSTSSATGTTDGKELQITLAPGVSMQLRLIPAGEFTMGSPDSEPSRWRYEVQHRVRISRPFFLGATEVTQAQWTALMGANTILRPKGPKFPIDGITWDDCQTFCQRLQDKVGGGRRFRLPTEAEWEYACRAGSTTTYGYGDDAGQLPQYAWIDQNSSREAHPVAQLKPNAWGLYDMHGNLFEWCQDWFQQDYYASSPPNDPSGPASGAERVARGGCWFWKTGAARSAFRQHFPTRGVLTGFRVVCEAP